MCSIGLLITVAISRTCFAYCVLGVSAIGMGIDFAVGKIGGRVFRFPSEAVVVGTSNERALATNGEASVAPFRADDEGIRITGLLWARGSLSINIRARHSV